MILEKYFHRTGASPSLSQKGCLLGGIKKGQIHFTFEARAAKEARFGCQAILKNECWPKLSTTSVNTSRGNTLLWPVSEAFVNPRSSYPSGTGDEAVIGRKLHPVLSMCGASTVFTARATELNWSELAHSAFAWQCCMQMCIVKFKRVRVISYVRAFEIVVAPSKPNWRIFTPIFGQHSEVNASSRGYRHS